jgi:hypothetical protein
LIFLVFFLPLAIYLLILGGINRSRKTRMVSGVWDFIGILFAASGFILFGGPAVLSGMSERWRQYWLFGKNSAGTPLEGIMQVWMFFSILYFGLVVGGAGYFLYRQRRVTSIYNVEPALVEHCLQQISLQLGIRPVRSGNLFLFGIAGEDPVGSESLAPPPSSAIEGIQPPHQLHATEIARPMLTDEQHFLGQTAVLEVDTWIKMRHVTLRWDPAESLFRHEIEAQLRLRLAEIPPEDSEVGSWLMLAGLAFLCLVFWGALVLVIYNRLTS